MWSQVLSFELKMGNFAVRDLFLNECLVGHAESVYCFPTLKPLVNYVYPRCRFVWYEMCLFRVLLLAGTVP